LHKRGLPRRSGLTVFLPPPLAISSKYHFDFGRFSFFTPPLYFDRRRCLVAISSSRYSSGLPPSYRHRVYRVRGGASLLTSEVHPPTGKDLPAAGRPFLDTLCPDLSFFPSSSLFVLLIFSLPCGSYWATLEKPWRKGALFFSPSWLLWPTHRLPLNLLLFHFAPVACLTCTFYIRIKQVL